MGERHDPILSLAEAAGVVKISRKQLERVARRGGGPFRKVEGRWRCYESELHDWFRSHEPRTRSSSSADPMRPIRPRQGDGSLKAQVIELRARRKAA